MRGTNKRQTPVSLGRRRYKAAPTQAQNTTGAFTGRVNDGAGMPVAGATVVIAYLVGGRAWVQGRQNEEVEANSASLIRDRINAALTWSEAFVGTYKTTVGLF